MWFNKEAEELARKKALAGGQAPGIGFSFTEALDQAKGYLKSGSEAPTGAIGDGASLGLKFNGTDAIKKGSDELISFGTDATGKSIGGLTGGTVAGVAADAVMTGDARAAATDAVAQAAGTAAGTAVAGPLGGMIGGALASSLVPKKKKRDLDPDKVHLI